MAREKLIYSVALGAVVVAAGWFVLRQIEPPSVTTDNVPAIGSDRSSSTGLRRDSRRAPGVRQEPDQSAVIRALEETIGVSGELGTRLIALNRLADLKGKAATLSLAGLTGDAALPVRVRRQALLLLANRPGAIPHETMVAMLASEEVDLRLAAAQGLGILGQAEGFEALDAAFLVEPSTGVAKAIVQSMARIGTPEAVEALLAHSAPDNLPSDMDRDAVLGALAGIANPEAVPALTAALVEAPDAESRRALVSSLARVADPTSFDHFLEIAQSDPDHETRCQAMQGLGMIGDPLALETLRAIESSSEDTREQSYARTAIQRIEGR